MPMDARLLVVAKAPVAGAAKTRLAVRVGAVAAAEIAAAALLDTLEVCAQTVGPTRCHLALAGELCDAARGEEIRRALRPWQVWPQRGASFAQRLVEAHRHVDGPRVQIGMDTPQITPALLDEVARGLADDDAVLAPAEDGGWWAFAARGPAVARPLIGVAMSRPTTYDDTSRVLRAAGHAVGRAGWLRDVDEVDDLVEVARQAPSSRFAAAVGELLEKGAVIS